MTRILGIDPGSRATGYGIIETESTRHLHIAHGVIRTGEGSLSERLLAILQQLSAVIAEHRPQEVAMEAVFVKQNVGTALILGQARGAAICAVAGAGLALHEYAPAKIKLAVVGSGRAEKPQVQHMVKVLLNLRAVPAADAADALACAMCHAHLRGVQGRMNAALKRAWG